MPSFSHAARVCRRAVRSLAAGGAVGVIAGAAAAGAPGVSGFCMCMCNKAAVADTYTGMSCRMASRCLSDKRERESEKIPPSSSMFELHSSWLIEDI